MITQDVDHRRVRYSQFSIKPCFSDGQTSVLTWIDALPHSVPLEVMNIDGEAYVSLDNKKLYSAKNYSPNQSVKCVVYNAQDPVTSLMEDHGLDLLTVIWCSGNELHRLSLRAKTVEAVFIIRCASQNSDFPFHGSYDAPHVSHQRIYSNITKKVTPANSQFIAFDNENYTESLQTSEELLIQPMLGINIYHQRNDFCQLKLELLFDVVKYEHCSMGWTLKARGEKDPDVWDDWDDLLAFASEAEGEREDLYVSDCFNSMNKEEATEA